MKKITLLGLLILLNQFTFAQDKVDSPKVQKIEGCVYASIVYQVGEKHRIQQSLVDAVTNKTTMVDAEPEIWQECVADKNADKTKSLRFHWRTLQN